MSIETGRLAPLADGAVLVQIGDTTLLSTVVTSKPREGIDFFPLTVDVEERMYAAGKIPAATASLAASQRMKGAKPSATVSAGE